MRQQTGPHDSQEVQRALDKILKRDFKSENSPLDRFWEWLEELFTFSRPEASLPGDWWYLFQKWLVILSAGALIFLAVRFVILKLVERYGPKKDTEEQLVPVVERVASLRVEAREARLAGNWQLALQKQFFALVLGLGERGDLEFRDAWTNRELLALGSPSPAVQAVLRPLLEELEPKEFGRDSVVAHDLDRLEALSLEYFGALLEQRP